VIGNKRQSSQAAGIHGCIRGHSCSPFLSRPPSGKEPPRRVSLRARRNGLERPRRKRRSRPHASTNHLGARGRNSSNCPPALERRGNSALGVFFLAVGTASGLARERIVAMERGFYPLNIFPIFIEVSCGWKNRLRGFAGADADHVCRSRARSFTRGGDTYSCARRIVLCR